MTDIADQEASSNYSLASGLLLPMAAPALDYRPPGASCYQPRIALVGAGGIAAAHLDAYRAAGLDVAVICNRTRAKAEARRDEFFPDAAIATELDAVLARDDVDIVDLATHAAERLPMMQRCIDSGRHVLSQKPFVLDLDAGQQLVTQAQERGVKLAVNQNGRWAPHLAWMREAVHHGLIGTVTSCHICIQWDHSWIDGTPFEKIDNLVLEDFGIHWFDFIASILDRPVTRVSATRQRSAAQQVAPPLLAQALLEFAGGQASLAFDGATAWGARDCTTITGTRGSLHSTGPDLGQQRVKLCTADGIAEPRLKGSWFNDGFYGAMAELIRAIESNDEPLNGAQANLDSLALAFAAISSSLCGESVVPGSVRRLHSSTG